MALSVEEAGFDNLPGADLVLQGLEDLRTGELTEYALLVLVAAPRLKGLGIDVPEVPESPEPVEHQLYSLLEENYADGAHSRFNSLRRRIVSFANALAHQSQ